MSYHVYSIRDDCTGRYTPPVLFSSDAEAQRFFRTAVAGDGYGSMSDYPQDFVLYRIGKFDDCTGIYVQLDHDVVMRGVDIVCK